MSNLEFKPLFTKDFDERFVLIQSDFIKKVFLDHTSELMSEVIRNPFAIVRLLMRDLDNTFKEIYEINERTYIREDVVNIINLAMPAFSTKQLSMILKKLIEKDKDYYNLIKYFNFYKAKNLSESFVNELFSFGSIITKSSYISQADINFFITAAGRVYDKVKFNKDILVDSIIKSVTNNIIRGRYDELTGDDVRSFKNIAATLDDDLVDTVVITLYNRNIFSYRTLLTYFPTILIEYDITEENPDSFLTELKEDGNDYLLYEFILYNGGCGTTNKNKKLIVENLFGTYNAKKNENYYRYFFNGLNDDKIDKHFMDDYINLVKYNSIDSLDIGIFKEALIKNTLLHKDDQGNLIATVLNNIAVSLNRYFNNYIKGNKTLTRVKKKELKEYLDTIYNILLPLQELPNKRVVYSKTLGTNPLVDTFNITETFLAIATEIGCTKQERLKYNTFFKLFMVAYVGASYDKFGMVGYALMGTNDTNRKVLRVITRISSINPKKMDGFTEWQLIFDLFK